MWGTSNQILLALTNQFMADFKIMYTGFNVNGNKKSKNHKGGSVKGLAVRIKNMLVSNRLRNKARELFHESLLKRKKDAHRTCVVLLPASVATQGFNGWRSLHRGHPELPGDNEKENSAMAVSPSTPEKQVRPAASTPRSQEDMHAKLERFIKEKRSEEKARTTNTAEGRVLKNLLDEFQAVMTARTTAPIFDPVS